MAVLIRAERVEQKIRELAARTGESLTEAVEKAVDDRLATTAPKRKGRVDREGLAKLLAEIDALPVVDPRSPDEIMDWDDSGLPR